MTLPQSFLRDGFVNKFSIRQRQPLPGGGLLHPLLIGTEGETNTGKSEFILSCPGPGLVLVVDRGIDGMLDNPNPPSSRREDFAFRVVKIPPNTTATQPQYLEYYNSVRNDFYKALDNKDAVTVAIDGDSDFWELQKLANFGKLTQVWPVTKYGDTYAQKRAMISRAWDSGKVVIATNKVKDEYEASYDSQGNALKESDGSDKRVRSGRKERQGFPDQDYLWQIQIRHLCKSAYINPLTKKEVPMQWGLVILKCKSNPQLKGLELWGEDCNFKGLVSTVYPHLDLKKEWGIV